jgi:hypothetical protein
MRRYLIKHDLQNKIMLSFDSYHKNAEYNKTRPFFKSSLLLKSDLQNTQTLQLN